MPVLPDKVAEGSQKNVKGGEKSCGLKVLTQRGQLPVSGNILPEELLL